MDHESVIKVMVVEDFPLVRRGITAALDGFTDLMVVCELTTGAEALHLCDRFRPDVILMDLTMFSENGLAAIRSIRQFYPAVQVIALIESQVPQAALSAITIGAHVCLPTNVSVSTLVDTIRRVHRARVVG